MSIDVIGDVDADADRYRQSLEILLAADEADAVLVMNCPTALAKIADAIIALVEHHRTAGHGQKTVLATWLGGRSQARGSSCRHRA